MSITPAAVPTADVSSPGTNCKTKNLDRSQPGSSAQIRATGFITAAHILSKIDASVIWQQFRDLSEARIGANLKDFLRARQPLIWLLAMLIGLAVAYAAIGFRVAIGYTQLIWLGTTTERVAFTAAQLPWYVVLSAPIIGGAIVGALLHRFVTGQRAHSIADVIEARAIKDCNIPLKTGLWSAALSAISLGFGASAGREGPIVHLGATLASFAQSRFALSKGARRTLLACGVSAAISATFNAPIAGVLFAHEVILAHYAFRAFVPITIASVIAAIITHTHLGDSPAFTVPYYEIVSFWEFPAFALLGVVCALVAVLFSTSMMVTERVIWRFDMPIWLRPIIGGFFVGLIALWFPQVLGVGYDATDAALHAHYTMGLMLALIIAKTAATAITLGSRFAGGIFGPALYLGAMAGGAFGLMAAQWFPELHSSSGLYALLGMGAVSAAVIGAPISTTLIVFELTKGFDITIALLLTVSIANGLSHAALGFSYFHWQLTKRGLSVREGPHKEIMRHLQVHTFMSALDDGETLDPIDFGDDMPWLSSGDSLETALRAFDETGQPRIAVVGDADRTQIIGWAERLNALDAYNQALIASHVEEHR